MAAGIRGRDGGMQVSTLQGDWKAVGIQKFAAAVTDIDSPRRLPPLWELRAGTRMGRWPVNRHVSSAGHVPLAVVMGVAPASAQLTILLCLFFLILISTLFLYFHFFFIIKICTMFTEE